MLIFINPRNPKKRGRETDSSSGISFRMTTVYTPYIIAENIHITSPHMVDLLVSAPPSLSVVRKLPSMHKTTPKTFIQLNFSLRTHIEKTNVQSVDVLEITVLLVTEVWESETLYVQLAKNHKGHMIALILKI
mmetsp:Transcript_31279/g.54987  ORF Transcript_31279/g.54987 Transcript_31279/m.54987 type:complete len:133 (-) Transcript_31279:217-615(-)